MQWPTVYLQLPQILKIKEKTKPIKQVMSCQFEYQIDDNFKTRTKFIQVSSMIKSSSKWLIRHQKCLQIKLTVNFLFLLPCVLHQKCGKKDRPIIIVTSLYNTICNSNHHMLVCKYLHAYTYLVQRIKYRCCCRIKSPYFVSWKTSQDVPDRNIPVPKINMSGN